eukprot:13851059-Ditylum_brightwellii.AAC.1
MASSSIPRSATPEHLLFVTGELVMYGSEQHMCSLPGHRDGPPDKTTYCKWAWSAIAVIAGAYDDVLRWLVYTAGPFNVGQWPDIASFHK